MTKNSPAIPPMLDLLGFPPTKKELKRKKKAERVKRPMPEMRIEDGRIVGPLPKGSPVIVSFGVGVDSWAMLIEMHRQGLRPDVIGTALVGRDDYGNEHRGFYSYLFLANQWLVQHGFPSITFVSHVLKKKAKHFHYLSLAGACISNRTLPSLAFRQNHSCSLRSKGQQLDAMVTRLYGHTPCYRLVGYDCTEGKRVERFATTQAELSENDPRYNDVYVHPLQIWGMNRADCLATIAAAGLPSPGKSSCIFCPSMRPEEVDQLFVDELWRIVIVEANAQPKLKGSNGEKGIKGLWTEKQITDYIVRRGLLPADLVNQTWDKWSSVQRPPEFDDPNVVADQVLFDESYRLAELCGHIRLNVFNEEMSTC